MTKTPLTLMSCPTRRPCMLFPKPWDGTFVAHNASSNSSSDNVAARGDYAANSGSQQQNQLGGGPTSLAGAKTFNWASSSLCNGISYERSEVALSDVSDGASNTFMFGEKYLNPDHYATGNSGGDNESMYTGFNNDPFRSTNTSYTPMQDQPGFGSTVRFGSAHWSGCNFVFCDGRVQMIGYTINSTTYSLLGNRRDGRVISGSGF